MKALVYTDTEETTYRDEADPAPGPGDAVVQVEAVGICGSDMHAWHGHDPRRVPPLILGHEACGIVLTGGTPGARVILNPLITCGKCEHCTTGRSNLCPDRELIGMRIPGAFADRIALPAGNLIPVPADMDPSAAALTEPCATAWHALTLAARAAWRPIGDLRTLVIGGGSVGLLGGLILQSWGASEVRIAETNPLRRKSAMAAGLDTFDPLATPPVNASADIVLDAVGATVTRAAAIAAVRPGGVISHIGLQDWAGDF
ncbi:MAG: alcohol dehydrogenase catalytic domain-containing protein, partial [Alphaproteobacteria bacterium]|nr:alcohol dehydrogenase catalytic domain-containing protein [Alphaproteobacteria bacterium]